MSADVKNQVFDRSQLWSGKGGRDYIKVGGCIYSINGLYCDSKGNPDRYGAFVVVIDIRWPVVEVAHWDEGKLRYLGDSNDVQALDHWGYAWEARDQFPAGDFKRVPSVTSTLTVPA